MLQRIVVPDLVGGVSRQPDGQRFPNQVEEADNVFMHLTQGLEKRAGSEVVGTFTDFEGDLHIHWVDRSALQKFFVAFREDAAIPVEIRTLAGTICTVTYPSAEAAVKLYLNTASSNIKAITVDDTTIVVNTSMVTAYAVGSTSYLHGGTSVDTNANVHNKASWEEFDLPPSVSSENWYAKDDALGHPAGWYQSISTTVQPWYTRLTTPMVNSLYDFGTLPVRIVQTGATTFEIRQCPWIGRRSGDSQTNPGPSFIGKAITDVCVHRNRLWFSAGENIVGSVSGSFYDFWLNSYASVIDSDPIDVKLSSKQVTKVLWMAPFQRSIVVFTESGQQYEIRAQEAMSPTTVSVIPSTAYTSPDVRPAVVGSQLYWAANRGPWSQVYEYLTDEAAAQSIATDAAAHVAGYIPSGIAEIKTSTANDIMVLRSAEKGELFVNFMFWQGDKKIQSAWTRWALPTTHTLVGLHVFDDYLYVYSRVEGEDLLLRLEKIALRHSDSLPSYAPRLDSRVTQGSGAFDAVTKRTTFVITKHLPELNEAFLGSQWSAAALEGSRYTLFSVVATPTDTTVQVNGNLSAHAVVFGTTILSSVQLSKQLVRDQQGVPAVGALQLKQASIHHRDTGFFSFEVDPRTDPANTRVYKYTGKSLGAIGFITNLNSLSDRDSQNFKIMGSSGNVDLRIASDSPAPLNITGAEFTADFVVGKRSAAST